MKIKAAVLYKTNTPFQVETIDLEPPRAGEVLVKIAAAGICHSDYHVATGHTERPTPIVLGHEGAGMVTAVGEDVTHVKVGDHVLLSWLPNCGTCFYCLNNRPNLCQAYLGPIWNGTMTDGTLRLSKNPIYHLNFLSCWAEYAVVPQESCVVLHKEIPFNVAAVIGCAVTTVLGAAFKTAQVRPGSSALTAWWGWVEYYHGNLAGASRIIAVARTPISSQTRRAMPKISEVRV